MSRLWPTLLHGRVKLESLACCKLLHSAHLGPPAESGEHELTAFMASASTLRFCTYTNVTLCQE